MTKDFSLLVISRSLFLFAITLPFDIRDLEFDKQTHLMTIPGTFGVRAARILGMCFILAFLAVETTRYLLSFEGLPVFTAFGLSGIIGGLFIFLSKPNGSEYFYSLGLEGTMIIQLLLVILATLIS